MWILNHAMYKKTKKMSDIFLLNFFFCFAVICSRKNKRRELATTWMLARAYMRQLLI